MTQSEPPLASEQKSRRRMSKPLILILLIVDLIIIGAAAASILLPGPLTENKTVVIPHGTSVREVASTLEENGVISNKFMFRIISRVLAGNKLHAGEYQFNTGQSLIDAVFILRDGHAIIRRFTVPEGLTSYEVVNLLRNDPVLTGDIVSAPAEGSILPETYHYSYGDDRNKLLERMQTAHRDLMNDLWPKRDITIPVTTPEATLVMASIVEKETGQKAEERARVAGVFYNRLKNNMRLQSDPTTIYALTNGNGPLGRELTRADLNTISPYNTYTSDGLPPGPICNPGRASIEAALHPEQNDYLYFVADGTGGHAFAKNLEEHNKNVAHWLSLLRP